MKAHVTDKNCTGCLACQSICPRHAITCDTSTGFIRPVVDETVCVNCGLCLRGCPKEAALEKTSFLQQTYAVKHTDATVLKNSTSGGAFSSVANTVIRQKGVVYGCVFQNGKIQHLRTEQDYSGMRGSKYVQSDLKNTYLDIAEDLDNGRTVLFTGTPCQCDAVKKFLSQKKTETTRLILVDFVCLGTTSPVLFDDYLSYCENKAHKKIDNHLFRAKIQGWTKHTEVNSFSDGTKDFQSYESQLFKSIFHSHLGMNEGCFECKFTSSQRVSDMTLADFWGVNKSRPELFDENGVSFVLINSEKGKTVFDQCWHLEKHAVSIADTEQPSLSRPAPRPEKYEAFWRDYHQKGFGGIVKKYYHGGKIYRALSDLYHTLRKR